MRTRLLGALGLLLAGAAFGQVPALRAAGPKVVGPLEAALDGYPVPSPGSTAPGPDLMGPLQAALDGYRLPDAQPPTVKVAPAPAAPPAPAEPAAKPECPEAPPPCPPSCPCPPRAPRAWFGADYLLWWVKNGPLPPLVVTGSLADPFPGALDQPGTRVLFGGSNADYGTFSGLRLGGGVWLDDNRTFAVEGGGFLLDRRSVGFRAATDPGGNPVLGLSFVNALTGNENVYLSGFPEFPIITGSVAAASRSRLFGWEANAAAAALRGGNLGLDVLAGFRSVGLNEDLQVISTFATNQVFDLGPGVPPLLTPFSGSTFDQFRVNNRFYGPQLGGRLNWAGESLAVSLVGKVALGTMQEVATVGGGSVVNNAGVITSSVGGIYAQTTNIGRHFHQEFAVVPEVGLNAGWRVTQWLLARVGYNFLYLSTVARPGDLVDRSINPNLVPSDPNSFGTPGGRARPAFSFRQTDFWAQGVNFGLELRF